MVCAGFYAFFCARFHACGSRERVCECAWPCAKIREARHENLLPFVGASVEHGAVALLYAYCARGSLRDVLANEDLHLDTMFVSSLVADLLKVTLPL